MDAYVFGCVSGLEVVVVYGVVRFDGIAFIGYVHCLAFLWVQVHEPV